MFSKYNCFVIFGLLLLSATYLAAYNFLNYMGVRIEPIPYESLYIYQDNKANNSTADLIFVGDSSLGNSIDAELFSKLASRRGENYALTAGFGLRGSLDMVKKIHQRDPALRTVVLMQTVDIFTKTNPPVYKPTKRYFKSKEFEGVQLNIFNYATFCLFLKSLDRGIEKKAEESEFSNDYIRQGKPINSKRSIKPLTVGRIMPESTIFLNQFDRYCQDQKLKCIYVHGPIIDSLCDGSEPYMRAINGLLSKTHFIFVDRSPLCIPREKVGDSPDHVRPIYKDDYTRGYYELLKPYL